MSKNNNYKKIAKRVEATQKVRSAADITDIENQLDCRHRDEDNVHDILKSAKYVLPSGKTVDAEVCTLCKMPIIRMGSDPDEVDLDFMTAVSRLEILKMRNDDLQDDQRAEKYRKKFTEAQRTLMEAKRM